MQVKQNKTQSSWTLRNAATDSTEQPTRQCGRWLLTHVFCIVGQLWWLWSAQ